MPDKESSFVPTYNKPETPGVHISPGNTIAAYHVVREADSFEEAAQEAFGLIRKAQERFPDWPRVYYLDVQGHRGRAKGFEPAFYEFQQEFLFSTIAPFVTALETPLTGPLVNPDEQRNDVPDRLTIEQDVRPHTGQVIPDQSPATNMRDDQV